MFGANGLDTGLAREMLFGGGIRRGVLHGRTADERPCVTVDKPLSIGDLHATVYRAMGIPADYGLAIEQRPFYVTKDGKGKAVAELFA
jgi:hypothetical protein